MAFIRVASIIHDAFIRRGCPECSSKSIHFESKGSFEIMKCHNCGAKYLMNVPHYAERIGNDRRFKSKSNIVDLRAQ